MSGAPCSTASSNATASTPALATVRALRCIGVDCSERRTAHTVASQAAGAISTLLVFPLDTVRFRTMSQDGTAQRRHSFDRILYRGVLRPMALMVREEGVASLFRGATVATGGATAAWGIYMYTYRTGQDLLRQQQQRGATGELARFSSDSVASVAASLTSAFIMTPVWHVKTRMQVEDTTEAAVGTSNARQARKRTYRHFVPSLVTIARREGVRALWRGLPAQLGMATVNALNFPCYEAATRAIRSAKGVAPTARLDWWEIGAASVASKTAVAAAANPLFVVRTRLQDARSRAVPGCEYPDTRAVLRGMAAREGLRRGLFRGLGVTVAVTAPKAALYMWLMERCVEGLEAAARV
jgi:hypothetical protein